MGSAFRYCAMAISWSCRTSGCRWWKLAAGFVRCCRCRFYRWSMRTFSTGALRCALLAATVPIAIAANAARVTLMGILSEYRADLAYGTFHLLEGWVLFLVALGLLITVHQLLRRHASSF